MNLLLPLNFTEIIENFALTHPETTALILPKKHGYIQYRYAALAKQISAAAIGLENQGITRGTRTILMVKPNIEFFVLSLALLKIGAIVVFIDPRWEPSQIKSCINQTDPAAFIGTSSEHMARIFSGWGKRSIKILVTLGRRYFWEGTTYKNILQYGFKVKKAYLSKVKPADDAAIVFTSESNEAPKGIVYQHGHLISQAELLQKYFPRQAEESILCTHTPLAFLSIAAGVTAVIPNITQKTSAPIEPKNILQLVKKFKISSLFSSSENIKKVAEYAAKKNLKTLPLKRIITTGTPVSGPDLQLITQMLHENTPVFNLYGSPEILFISLINHFEILGETQAITNRGAGVCLGKPLEENQIVIIPIFDQPISEWDHHLKLQTDEIGEIVVCGPTVTESYFEREDLIATTKMKMNNAIWHRTGDLGYLDNQGRLWYCGNKNDRVILKDKTLFTVPCEAVFNTHPQVLRSALIATPLLTTTENRDIKRNAENILAYDTPVLCVELKKDQHKIDKNKIIHELLAIGALYPHTNAIKNIIIVDKLPSEQYPNPKLLREKLNEWLKQAA